MYQVSFWVLKAGRRIFGGYRKSFQHGNYIRPEYVSIWKEALRQAKANNVSLSEFVSQALYYFMTGKRPDEKTLSGRNPVDITFRKKKSA